MYCDKSVIIIMQKDNESIDKLSVSWNAFAAHEKVQQRTKFHVIHHETLFMRMLFT